MTILPDLTGLIPRQRCRACGMAYRTLGPGSVWVPHRDGCPRNPFKRVEAAGVAQPGRAASRAVEAPRAVEAGTSAQVAGSNPAPHPASTQSTFEQDQEREALTELEAPFRPMIRWPEGPSALSDMVWRS